MSNDYDELMRVQENCMDILKIAIDKMNKTHHKPSRSFRDIYQDQFINVNEQFLRGTYNDRQRDFRKVSKR